MALTSRAILILTLTSALGASCEKGAGPAPRHVAAKPTNAATLTPGADATKGRVLLVNLPYVYDHSARTLAFNAAIKTKDERAQRDVQQMNDRGNARVAEYRKIQTAAERAEGAEKADLTRQAATLLEEVQGLKRTVEAFIATTRASFMEEVESHRRQELARILAVVDTFRVQEGFAVAYDSNRTAHVGMEMVPVGIDGIDCTSAVLEQVNR